MQKNQLHKKYKYKCIMYTIPEPVGRKQPLRG